jgi:Spy/CpxP family protein refolding chaperone
MKGKFSFKIGALLVVLGIFLLVPKLVQAAKAEEEMEQYLKDFKAQIFQQLNLSPEKEKAFKAVEDKHAAERQKIVAHLNESQKQLETLVATSKPGDKEKIRHLVHAIAQDQDKIFASYKSQRNEELALLTPEQQGKYLVAMINWRHAMMERAMKEEGGKKMGEEPKQMQEAPKQPQEIPKEK